MARLTFAFVCTNYNNAHCTEAAVRSLHAEAERAKIRLPVVIVDNASDPAEVDRLRALATRYPDVHLVLNDRNVGYFEGLNQGLHRLATRVGGVDVAIIGNNDLLFPAGFVDQIATRRTLFERWAVVAPDIVTFEGIHQNPHVRTPISWRRQLIWEVFHASYAAATAIHAVARLTRRFTAREENRPESGMFRVAGPVEQGHGACYLLGPEFFRRFDRLCAPTLMLREEFFLYEQLKLIGQLTYYEPGITVQHLCHGSTGRIPSRRRWELARDAHRVYRRYRRMSAEDQRHFFAAHGAAPNPIGPAVRRLTPVRTDAPQVTPIRRSGSKPG